MSDQQYDGGPAFPVLLQDHDAPRPNPDFGATYKQHPGMTLLDHFAGLVMQVIVAERKYPFDDDCASDSYGMAERMVAERKRRYG